MKKLIITVILVLVIFPLNTSYPKADPPPSIEDSYSFEKWLSLVVDKAPRDRADIMQCYIDRAYEKILEDDQLNTENIDIIIATIRIALSINDPTDESRIVLINSLKRFNYCKKLIKLGSQIYGCPFI